MSLEFSLWGEEHGEDRKQNESNWVVSGGNQEPE